MGDVGSGKTVVALHALVAAADSDRQAAMMAPTEVLAVQYATQLGPYLDSLKIRWALLTSSTPATERAGLLAGLSTNQIKVVFGTHALIEPDVVFDELVLVVIDEQHRFGVAQRDALRPKGESVHQLTMTATPIPRSQALTIYGDQDVSQIRSRPRANAKITTQVLDRSVIGVAYDAVKLALMRGEQAYIVCPLIGQSEAGQARGQARGQTRDQAGPDDDSDEPAESFENDLLTEYSTPDENLTAATRERDFLASKVFPEYTVGLMTSRLPTAEKRKVMDDFRAGRIDVLVSTTVIEVGVDVPNATVMVIQDADRFGLSQLHQLRGRVGRGSRDGEAYLISNSNSADARERLSAMERSNDGFELAEEDLRLRQEGDVLGLRQHGKAILKLVQVIRDREMIERAHVEARELLADDPELTRPEHALLAWELELVTRSWQQTDDETTDPVTGRQGVVS
jgi:ATP-dependent DNA helicase RecG